MDIINAFFGKLEIMLHKVLTLLPLSPFSAVENYIADMPYLTAINYFIPIGTIVAITEAWVACIATYYFYSIVLRWIKAVE